MNFTSIKLDPTDSPLPTAYPVLHQQFDPPNAALIIIVSALSLILSTADVYLSDVEGTNVIIVQPLKAALTTYNTTARLYPYQKLNNSIWK